MSDATPHNEDRAAEILAEALNKSGEELRDYLAAACGDDIILQLYVRSLLDAQPDAERYFDSMGPRAARRDATARAAAEVPVRAGQVLGHYRLDRLLGTGGMGEVYRAEDLALGRVVAIKLLRQGVDPDLRARLFKESEATARIEHPAVATFYEHGRAQDQDYLAMEYVEGTTLRDRLRHGPLPVDEALALVYAVLEGLVHAHAHGIVHRDIKPENIMVTPQGTPKLLDFGIAKDVHLPESGDATAHSAAVSAALTGHGCIVGTVGYMSPEQLRGKAVSEQTDIFAVGAVLYEMLAGERAFPGRTARDCMNATLSRDIPPLNVQDVHAGINDALRRALARDCRNRYPSAADFLRDLRDLGSGIRPTALPNTVAILGLENLTGNQDDDWIGAGTVESLSAALSPLAGLELVPRKRVLQAAAEQALEDVVDPVALGLALGCRWVLSGTYQHAGARLRLTVRFVEVATGRNLWVEKLDGTTDQLLEMQDRLALKTAGSLNLARPQEAGQKPELSVHELYAKGRKFFMAARLSDIASAAEQFEKAIAIDPDYAPALAGLACLQAPYRWAVSADPALLAQGEELAGRAIAADPAFGESYIWLGYSLWRQGRYEEAIRALETAEELDPSEALAWYFHGTLHCECGDYESAVAGLRQGLTKDKNNVFILNCLGYAHAELGHFAEAEWIFGRAIDLVRDGGVAQWGGSMQMLSACYLRQGKLQEAWNLCKEFLGYMEGNEHAYRSFARLSGLQLLAEIALARGDLKAAEVAIGQAVAMAQAQPTGPNKGHIMVQSLALQSIIGSDQEPFEAAKNLERCRLGFDFSWAPGICEDRTLYMLAKAARHLELPEEAAAYYRRARAAGTRLPLE